MKAPNEEERNRWVEAINRITKNLNYSDQKERAEVEHYLSDSDIHSPRLSKSKSVANEKSDNLSQFIGEEQL